MPESEPTPLDKICKLRRSVRNYGEEPVAAKDLDYIREVISVCPNFGDKPAHEIMVLDDAEAVSRLINKGLLSGLKSTPNRWLKSGSIGAALVGRMALDAGAMATPASPLYLITGAIAMEYAVLAAAERGVGTCWLGAYNELSVQGSLDLDPSVRVFAASPLGLAAKGPSGLLDLSARYDQLTSKILSAKRLPMEKIAFMERFGQSWSCAEVQQGPMAATESQDVIAGLVREWSKPKPLSGQAVTDAALTAMLECARIAPSAHNAQPWRFVAVRDKAIVERIGAALKSDREALQGYSALIVAAATDFLKRQRGPGQPYGLIDVPIAVSHIMLKAAELGAACRLFLDFDPDSVREYLGFPNDALPVAIVGLG